MSSLSSDSWFAPHPDAKVALVFPTSLRLPSVGLTKQPLCIMLTVPAWMLCVVA